MRKRRQVIEPYGNQRGKLKKMEVSLEISTLFNWKMGGSHYHPLVLVVLLGETAFEKKRNSFPS